VSGHPDDPLRDWLLFLGAGASVARPTRLPLFYELSAGVLQGIGWTKPAATSATTVWTHSPYPPFADPDLSAEVLFGALRRFGAEFTAELADLFRDRPANAVHHLAAAVLAAEGCVWTTNVDVAVELACAERAITPPIATRAADRALHRLNPLRDATPGTLVKLHGTAAIPTTMAFTDLELMSPLPPADAQHLAGLADGRTIVLYGYAGADADLADLLDDAFSRARAVAWCEPSAKIQDEIRRAFRHAERIQFLPDLPAGQAADVPGTVIAILALAAEAGVEIRPELIGALRVEESLPAAPQLRLADPPGISHARLVERFGAPADHDAALRAARRADRHARRWDTVPDHVHWTITRSLYNNGIVATIVQRTVQHRSLLARVRPLRLRDYLITRAAALLLQDSDPPALGRHAQWAIDVRADASGRPYPSDL